VVHIDKASGRPDFSLHRLGISTVVAQVRKAAGNLFGGRLLKQPLGWTAGRENRGSLLYIKDWFDIPAASFFLPCECYPPPLSLLECSCSLRCPRGR
jgi:hypothetical protein